MEHINRLTLAVAALLASMPLASAQDAVRYVHLDALGSVRAVSNEANVVIERHDYLPFGEECTTGPCASNPGAGAGQPRKFTGKERDQETGLDYFGARYYGARMSRFTTQDPVLDQKAALTDPQRWNRYAYGLNNPIRYTDPDGRNPAILQLIQRIANSPAGQRLTQLLSTQWANLRMAALRMSNSPAAQEAASAAAQIATGTDIPPAPGPVVAFGTALRFGQKGISQVFRHGKFAGQTIDQVAYGLRHGTIPLDDVPVQVITRDGVTYAMNNRSLMALRQAGFEPTAIDDVTGVAEYEARLSERLSEMGGQIDADYLPPVRPMVKDE